jgi:argininosuccinate lyase
MDNTGIIKKGLHSIIKEIIFGTNSDQDINEELIYNILVDKVHIEMLLKQGLISSEQYFNLSNTINHLEQVNFSPLLNKQADRGIYLLYEDYLIEKLGIETGGVLQTGRSRNDLKATVLLLKTRKPFISLLSKTIQLVNTLISKSVAYCDTIMPIYTHYQAAVPITYGHYLQGIAFAIIRDVKRFLTEIDAINTCPIGACAVGGTSIPIDNYFVAEKLGFSKVFLNSIDAVASRDVSLSLQADIVVLSTTLSRLATDLQLWSSTEFKFFNLPDELVGSSSIMPNKRNAFVLENIQGKCVNSGIGFWVAANAFQRTPFTNSIVVGTEAMSNIWQSFKNVEEAVVLLDLFVSKAIPNSKEMLAKAISGNTFATELANYLVKQKIFSFREAHKIVGEYIYQAMQSNTSFYDTVYKIINDYKLNFDFSPEKIVKNTVFGGGAGESNIISNSNILKDEIKQILYSINETSQKWEQTINNLNKKNVL